MSGTPRSLEVIVLNYKTPAVTLDCLRTLADEFARFPEFHVTLVDNASGDDSVARIQAGIAAADWGDWLEFRPLTANLGFAGGNNLIMREQLDSAQPPEFILLLNSDTLVQPGCLQASVAALAGDPGVGALSCMLLNPDGSVQNVCRKFPRPDRETARAFGLPWTLPRLFGWADIEDPGWDRRSGPRDVDWIGGAFLLARAAALRRAGLLDDGFFFYGEDCELCFRIWKCGYRVRFDPSGETVHLGGASSDGERLRNHRRDLFTWRARFRVQERCYGRLARLWVHAVYTTVFALRYALAALRGQRGTTHYANMREGFHQLTGQVSE